MNEGREFVTAMTQPLSVPRHPGPPGNREYEMLSGPAQRGAISDIDALAQAIRAQADSIKAQNAAIEKLMQSVAMLAGAVAQLLEEEAGAPAQPEEPAKPAPDDLDAES